ncbi:DUF6658 family protein [Microseira wollei]|uniref:Uncharacterized protein n=1 Tax=Microseira wollei NIES-4236 TaxID=2530354 RepID=A0AAV3XDG6_9CYAN|nr:DUF6658 family protein [Microseira wollei]GET38392.1 hypothetical protein MiSe_31500 [Microseira wollei NIES-4236]
MKRIISFWQNMRIVRIVTVFLASSFLFFATACNPSNSVQAKALDTKAYPEQYVPKNAITNPREGGMNQFSDVDPRADRTGVEAKANYLEKKAEQNLQKRADTPEQYFHNYRSGTPLGERIENLGEDIGSSVKEVNEGVTKGTQRGLENIKENTQDAAYDVKSSAKQAASNVKENAQDAAYKAQRAADDVSSYAKDKSRELDRLD